MANVLDNDQGQQRAALLLSELVESIGHQDSLTILFQAGKVLVASMGWRQRFPDSDLNCTAAECLSAAIGLADDDWSQLLDQNSLYIMANERAVHGWQLQISWLTSKAEADAIGLLNVQQLDGLMIGEGEMSRVVDRISNLHGQALYDGLVDSLSQVLPVDLVMLGVLDSRDRDRVRSLSYILDGEIQPEIRYNLAEKPCADVLSGAFSVHEQALQKRYPQDRFLQELDMDSYLGVPLNSRDGVTLGLLVIMARRPLRISQDVMTLLRLIVSRIDVELEHDRATDQLALKELSLVRAERMAQLGGWVLNPLTQKLYCTESMCRLFQLPPAQREFHRHTLLNQVHSDERDALRRIAIKAIRQGEPFSLEHRICLPDGQERWMRTQAEVVTGSGGETLKLLGISQDITREVETGHQIFNSENRLHELIAASPYGITQIDIDLTITYANRVAHELHGCRSGEMIGRPLADFIHPDEVDHYMSLLGTLQQGNERISYQRRGVRKDGSVIDLDVAISVMHDEAGNALGYIGFLTDVTDRLRAESLLRQLSTAVEQSPSGILITDTDGLIQYANPSFCSISGYEGLDVLGQPLSILQPVPSRDDYAQMLETLKTGKNWQNELLNRRRNGTTYWGLISGAPITGDDGEISHYVVIQEDISLRKEQEELLAYQASYDAVTGLPNRLLAMDRLTQGIEASKRDKRHTVVMFIDLDQFKRINDTFGHSTGDELLVNAAKLLSDAVREADTVARFGGDEFLVIMDRVPNQEAIEKVSEKVLNAFNKPVYLGDHELLITASIGVAVYPQDGTVAETLLSNADAAMYSAKQRGRNCFHFFTPAMNQQAEERLRIESHLQRALEFNEMRLNFQPVVCLKSNRVTAAEALLRWDCHKLGPVSPDRFIPLAEDLGFIEELGRWVISQVLEQYSRWRSDDLLPHDFKIAINVSPKQFQRGQLADFVMSELARMDIAPEKLELEVTEGLLMERWPEVEEQIERLDSAGISLSIDDFGTGFSSISYLRKYPFKTLKIDRSFVMDVLEDRDDATLVQSIIALARSMGMNTIAEGVETEGQHHFLQQAGCDWMQGYFYSKPLSCEDFAALMRSQAEFLRRAGIPEL